MSDILIEAYWASLTSDGYQITSSPSQEYNCFAWAMGDDSRTWWPPIDGVLGGYYWPDGEVVEESAECFAAVFAKFGYAECDGPAFEEGVEKLAIYLDEDGIPQHVARQLNDGGWTSKLGKFEDIRHATLRGLEGRRYGQAARFFQRPVR